MIESTGNAVTDKRNLSPEERAAEALFMGLRLTDGVEMNEFRNTYGIDIMERYDDDILRFVDLGLLKIDNGRIQLTSRGILLSNEVFEAFV
jgi:oxygen-independent coproporphyrinogen-3 oxidase